MKHLRRARGCGCIFAAVSLARAPTTTRSSARPGGHPLLSPEAAALTKGQLEPGPRPRQPPAPGSTYRWCRETPKPRRPRSGPGGRLGRGRRPVSPAGTWRRCASRWKGMVGVCDSAKRRAERRLLETEGRNHRLRTEARRREGSASCPRHGAAFFPARERPRLGLGGEAWESDSWGRERRAGRR